MSDYVEYCKSKNSIIAYDNIINNDKEYKLFTKWFEEEIKPFGILRHKNNKYSITLDQDYFHYDLETGIREETDIGDGHDYEEIFKYYINEEYAYLNDSLTYDSENGMFCVYCLGLDKAEEVIYALSSLYKNEEKMSNLINEVNKEYEKILEKEYQEYLKSI